MKVKLLADYRGVLTDEIFYKAGEHDLPADVGAALINAGRAVSLEKMEVEKEVSPLPADYRELQKLARAAGIPANQKKEALIEALS